MNVLYENLGYIVGNLFPIKMLAGKLLGTTSERATFTSEDPRNSSLAITGLSWMLSNVLD